MRRQCHRKYNQSGRSDTCQGALSVGPARPLDETSVAPSGARAKSRGHGASRGGPGISRMNLRRFPGASLLKPNLEEPHDRRSRRRSLIPSPRRAKVLPVRAA